MKPLAQNLKTLKKVNLKLKLEKISWKKTIKIVDCGSPHVCTPTHICIADIGAYVNIGEM